SASYSPERISEAIEAIGHKPVQARIMHLIARLFFRGIYFPQMTRWDWMKVIMRNRKTVFNLIAEAIGAWRRSRNKRRNAQLMLVYFAAYCSLIEKL
ncbi:MAG TPA: hypothetical protein VJ302_04075, partial [Blastocatellia bacterium]|nr:hypothetical protein [Blastocatellia bacterium]